MRSYKLYVRHDCWINKHRDKNIFKNKKKQNKNNILDRAATSVAKVSDIFLYKWRVLITLVVYFLKRGQLRSMFFRAIIYIDFCVCRIFEGDPVRRGDNKSLSQQAKEIHNRKCYLNVFFFFILFENKENNNNKKKHLLLLCMKEKKKKTRRHNWLVFFTLIVILLLLSIGFHGKTIYCQCRYLFRLPA